MLESSNETQRVTIVGNADERGSVSTTRISASAAPIAVAQYLQNKGAGPSQVEAIISHGEESPICPDSNLKCWHSIGARRCGRVVTCERQKT